MNTYEDQIAMPVRTAKANSGAMARAKAIALEAAQTLSGTTRDALLAYAVPGTPPCSLASFGRANSIRSRVSSFTKPRT
jgi:hypothetical protein